MTISMDKKYHTRNGREVRIYAVDGEGPYPVHGAMWMGKFWSPTHWTENGKYNVGLKSPYDLDLIEVKPRIQREYWMNIYEGTDSTALWPSKKRADDQAENNDYRRLACVKIVVDCAEDEGL